MSAIKYVGLLFVIGIAAYWLLPDRPKGGAASAETPNEVYYLCKETKALIKLPPQSVPAAHPETGRATLYRALYCPDCKAWKAVPPPDVFPGNPLTFPCPKHQRQMTPSGPAESLNVARN